MNLNAILTLVAIFLGPILAVQVQMFIQRKREARNRKLVIFKTLMATRGAILNYNHVEALNRIDLEFSGSKKYKGVLSAWKLYFDNLMTDVENFSKSQHQIWHNENVNLLARLLLNMGEQLGYDFDESLIKRNIYYPTGHSRAERESDLIREKTLQVLSGQISIPVSLEPDSPDENVNNKVKKLQDLLIKYYSQKMNLIEEE